MDIFFIIAFIIILGIAFFMYLDNSPFPTGDFIVLSAIILVMAMFFWAIAGEGRQSDVNHYTLVKTELIDSIYIMPDGQVQCFIKWANVGTLKNPERYIIIAPEKRPNLVLNTWSMTGPGMDDTKKTIDFAPPGMPEKKN